MTPADRMNAALERHSDLMNITKQLFDLRRADLRHARTQSESDLLTLLETAHKLFRMLEKALCIDLDEACEDLRSEAIRECGFDLNDGNYIEVSDTEAATNRADDYGDYLYEQHRDCLLDEQIDRELGA